MNYAEFAQLPASEKVVLCIVEAVTQFRVWTFSFTHPYVFYKDVPHFVKSVKVAGAELVEIDSMDDFTGPTVAGMFYFDKKSKRLYVRMPGDVDPKTKQTVVTYNMFFSNQPYILPCDLDEGEPVEFDSRVDSIGNLGQQLDDENTGIVLESASQISLQNNDGFFDDIFDTLIWENQNITFYSWSPKIPIADAVKLFQGVIESKSFQLDKIVFNVKDYVYRLKNQVALSAFSESDGTIAPAVLGTPKRRIYGRTKQTQCIGIDNVLSGFALTGTISVALGSTALTGSSSLFLSELSPGDEIFVVVQGELVKLGLDSITSNTAAVLGDESDFNISALTAVVKPKVPYRQKNRRWHIAGHKLREPIATIVFPTSSRRFFVDSVDDFFSDDTVDLNGSFVEIRRISGQNIILKSSVFPLPAIGDTIIKNPVSKVYFGSKELIVDRDWTLTNGTNDAILEIDPLAEFNIANQRTVGVNLTFTNSSRSVTTASTIDLRTLMKPRDWIRKNSLTETDWYEILDVREQTVTLRTAFTGTTQTTSGLMKNVDLITDDSIITVDTFGMEYGGLWMRTASDAVKHLVMADAGFTDIDTAAFSQAKADCPFILSMVIPESIGGEAPKIRDVITKINESVFGSLYGNQSQEIAFTILNARKPTSLSILKDDDILSWTSSTEQKIVNAVKVNYRPFVDIYTGFDATETLEFQSTFVDNMIGIQNTEERTIYLYETDKATIIAQRIAFHRSLSNCKVTLKGKLNLALLTVNDKIYIELDRLFRRYGGNDSKKIGIVTGVKKNGFDVDVDLTDLGNIFNRVPVVAPTGTPSYSTATRDDAVKYGFILDNDTLTPDNLSETDLGNNLIG